MFQELTPILRKGDTLALTLTREADAPAATPDAPAAPTYRVNIMPKLFSLDGEKGADRQTLNTPLSIVGTAAELDSPEFLVTLNRFAASVTTTRHTIDEVEAAHQTALKTKQSAQSANAAKNKTNPVTSAARPAAKKPEPKVEAEPTEVTDTII